MTSPSFRSQNGTCLKSEMTGKINPYRRHSILKKPSPTMDANRQNEFDRKENENQKLPTKIQSQFELDFLEVLDKINSIIER